MQHAYQMLMKSQHFLFILLTIFIIFVVYFFDLSYVFFLDLHNETQTVAVVISYTLSFLASMTFLAVGLFVWFYARNRRIAWLFLGCCLTMMIFFTAETHPAINWWMDFLSEMSDISLIICLSAFLAVFPSGTLSRRRFGKLEQLDIHTSSVHTVLIVKGYLWFISAGGAGIAALYICADMQFYDVVSLLSVSRIVYLSFTLPGFLYLFLRSYYQSEGSRERQQLLLIGCGMIMGAPILVFSLFHNLSDYFSWHGILAEGMLCLLPLIAGYAVLRYQVLVFDSTVCKWVAMLFSVGFFALLADSLVTIGHIFPYQQIIQHRTAIVVCIVFSITLLTPTIWWLANVFTETLFFGEVRLYQCLLDEPTMRSEDILGINDVARLITIAVLYALQTARVRVFVFDDNRGQYVLYPDLVSHTADTDCRSLLIALGCALDATASNQESVIEYLDARLPAIQCLECAHRPLFLSELLASVATGSDKRRFISTSSLDDENWLLTPIRAQGKMIGLLVAGTRDDWQPHTGTDLEMVHQLAEHYAMALETARLYARVTHHTSLLNSLYNVSIMPNSAFSTVQDAATKYAIMAANSTSAAVEMWLYDRLRNELHLTVTTGHGPRLFPLNCLKDIQKSDWSSGFFTEDQTLDDERQAIHLPACLPQIPSCPFAWLPLHKDEQYMGILVITYARPHVFLSEEMSVLEMFANQCLSALENVQMTTELRAAYERQKELDLLKDQFIMTASHELRTPLTTILGYVELLDQYHERLEVTSRAEFIEKARLGCDELSLLVRNIMDANHVDIDADAVHLRPISLVTTVSYVLEMMEAIITREQRVVIVCIAADMCVSADDDRLRQVLLNLMSNALKYSAEGSNICISAQYAEEQVIVRIHDNGLGIPQDQQEQLFERFVRLERDINSPVRGAGLGLFICRRLLEAMGGRIWIESNGTVGGGSALAFALQLVPKKYHAETASAQLPI